MAPQPLSLRAYRAATAMFEPAAPLLLRRRARRGKEKAARLGERLGFASRARPEGQVIWIHGASVGECLAVLPLIEKLAGPRGRSVLLTSGTVTSADMMAERLLACAFHQFAPVDTPRAVRRFLDHWQPDIGLFVESEIWPNMLVAAHARGIRLALINGRMTEKSFAGWQRAPATAARLVSLYDRLLAQDAGSARRFASLGAATVENVGSLKADAAPLAADPGSLAALCGQIGDRPVFLATNTHPGEDGMLLAVHDRLRARFSTLLTVIVPRHAERGAEIGALSRPRNAALRSRGDPISAATDIYVGDTMGELGLFYRLATFAFIGKSLAGTGGQNPLEAARLEVAVLAGPHTENFSDAYEAIFAAQQFGRVTSPEALAGQAASLLDDPQSARRAATAAAKAILPLGGALERTRVAVEEMLAQHARA